MLGDLGRGAYKTVTFLMERRLEGEGRGRNGAGGGGGQGAVRHRGLEVQRTRDQRTPDLLTKIVLAKIA